MCTLYKAGSHLWARYSHSTPLAPSPTHLSPDIAVHPWRKGVQNHAQLRTTDLGGVRNAHSEVMKICSEFPSKEIPYWSFSFFFLSCFFFSFSCSFCFKSYPGIFFFLSPFSRNDYILSSVSPSCSVTKTRINTFQSKAI